MNRRILSICFGLSVGLCTAAALADPTARPHAASDDGYSYQFTDDPMQAGGFGPTDPRIVVAAHGVHATLIRPRTSFVAELCKTVENL